MNVVPVSDIDTSGVDLEDIKFKILSRPLESLQQEKEEQNNFH